MSESFYSREIRRALSEQAFGICDYGIIDGTNTDVTAKVTLLEGQTCTINLSGRGYEITSGSSNDNGQGIYESLEELLQAISPRYLRRRAEALAARLSDASR